MTHTLRPLTPSDFPRVRPMLLDMGFVEDEAELAARFPAFCVRPVWMVLDGVEARGAQYLFWYANLREATPAYKRTGYAPGAEVQEGYRFFEVDFSVRTTRQPHPERGS
ncbi:hypothetical protein [Deinococcus daejeonensis]|uniref:GCN5-related N-acetyltransferase n=1 Tax=Deinococcus daejeonensis TaxID=1007098 RepID=A0ABQ2IYR2_9DEIO|nr:hypothetical protein [Deinococcus daejeonensis]GGN32141.1 hypothetical protein GCM10010842_08560 [Deinococcus daejeonensis]